MPSACRRRHGAGHAEGAGIEDGAKSGGLVLLVPDRQNGPVDEESAVIEPTAVEVCPERPFIGTQAKAFHDRDAADSLGLWLEGQGILQALREVFVSEVQSGIAEGTGQRLFQTRGSAAYATDRAIALGKGSGRCSIEPEHMLIACKRPWWRIPLLRPCRA